MTVHFYLTDGTVVTSTTTHADPGDQPCRHPTASNNINMELLQSYRNLSHAIDTRLPTALRLYPVGAGGEDKRVYGQVAARAVTWRAWRERIARAERAAVETD